MAKPTRKTNQPNQPQEPSSSRGPLLVLVAGSIAIAALIGWALTRSVEPAVPDAVTATPGLQMPANATSAATTTVVPPPASATATPEPNTGVSRVTPQHLKELVDRGAATVVDVRDSVSYTNGHIPGSVHIPFARVEGESRYLPKDKPIILYCT